MVPTKRQIHRNQEETKRQMALKLINEMLEQLNYGVMEQLKDGKMVQLKFRMM